MTPFGQKTPVRNEAGAIVGERVAIVARITRNELGSGYGSDRDRRLIVSLCDGDIITLKPERVSKDRTHSITAKDLWAHLERIAARNAQLETARERKLKLAARKIALSIRRANRRITAQAKINNRKYKNELH